MADNSIVSETYKWIRVVLVYYQYSDNKGIAIFEDVTALLRRDVVPIGQCHVSEGFNP